MCFAECSCLKGVSRIVLGGFPAFEIRSFWIFQNPKSSPYMLIRRTFQRDDRAIQEPLPAE